MSTFEMMPLGHPFHALFGTPRLPTPPKRPSPNGKWLGAVVVAAVFGLPGCTPKVYQAVPECAVVKPVSPERYLDASTDERLVLVSSTYIAQVKAVAKCNNDIRLINTSNKARDAIK